MTTEPIKTLLKEKNLFTSGTKDSKALRIAAIFAGKVFRSVNKVLAEGPGTRSRTIILPTGRTAIRFHPPLLPDHYPRAETNERSPRMHVLYCSDRQKEFNRYPAARFAVPFRNQAL